ncbi:hypothetical protein HXT25_04275 [Gardnerella sp. DNF00476]|uniref:hypothetical protein n=1 Tax=Gardnerella TaxID=2701 RepID=UPI00254CC181|nr:hypothetical protein [Gardnerella vaginalis]MDK7259556.1 hypothetical protein [Gardnerella vaginalis]MDK8776470.1 hypothetical protein [Gardnerella vaginalis]
MNSYANNPSNSTSSVSASHNNLRKVLIVAVIVVVLAIVSAFIWPGWALNRQQPQSAKTQVSSAKTPSIKSKDLPSTSTALLRSMPDSVLDFARVDACPSAKWSSASPLEEYTVRYSTGESGSDVSVVVAQWSSRDLANKQYELLTDALAGSDIASGKIQVAGKATGSYVLKADDNSKTKASAIWQNDTVVFEVTGLKQSVERFYKQFPM